METSWIRGVNLGGWLMLERYITPYQFAVTDCHIQGDFCWYPGQASAPPGHEKYCDFKSCTPYLRENVLGILDFPFDEYNLGLAFAQNQSIGEEWLDYHFQNFITEQHVRDLKKAGITHLRVPMPHWILGDIREGEPWLLGKRWDYFRVLVEWCREIGLFVWPDIHTAPGSQNGFDNSGIQTPDVTCNGWGANPDNVHRSLDVITAVSRAIMDDGMRDVVTGFGLLNEPFKDCDRQMFLDFIEKGLDIVRDTMGADTSVYVSDLFSPMTFNDGTWWLDPIKYANTFLDSHYYHVFAGRPRGLSPRQHIAYTCVSEYKATSQLSGSSSCCYEDAENMTAPSRGVKRIVGEWSAATDTLPVALLNDVMSGIAANASAPQLHRTLSRGRKAFLRNFVEAQMVSYEAADKGVGQGWFYWTARMEGGAFAEWDFLRGIHEGWVPTPLPKPDETSASRFGSCNDIIFRTEDSMSIIHEFPPPADDANNWQGVILDDDVVVTHGASLLKGVDQDLIVVPAQNTGGGNDLLFSVLAIVAFVAVAGFGTQFIRRARRKAQYEPIELSATNLTV